MKLGEIKDLTMSNELKYIFDRSKCFTQMVALPDPTLLNVIRINSFAVDKLFFDLKNLEKATLNTSGNTGTLLYKICIKSNVVLYLK